MKTSQRSGYLRLLLYAGLCGFSGLALLLWYCYFSYHAPLERTYRSQGQNALWARHQWVGEYHALDEYIRFAAQLKQHALTDVFVHVGLLDAQGLIKKERYLFAPLLLKHLKREYPELHIQAWIGQVEAKGGGLLDLAQAHVRANILQTAQTFLDLGFDGIHYDIEPIYSGDLNWLELLHQTKALTRAQHKILSIASDELEPFWEAERVVRLLSKQAGFWNEPFYRQVAAEVDQIAVMMYDTALPTDSLYGTIVKWQTQRLVQLLPPTVTLFMGVPTYADQRWSFHPKAENMVSGLRGIQKGLETFEPSAIRHFGVALYAEWTTDPDEWQAYQKTWLSPVPSANLEQ